MSSASERILGTPWTWEMHVVRFDRVCRERGISVVETFRDHVQRVTFPMFDQWFPIIEKHYNNKLVCFFLFY
jgi:hypothetical protein